MDGCCEALVKYMNYETTTSLSRNVHGKRVWILGSQKPLPTPIRETSSNGRARPRLPDFTFVSFPLK